MYTVCTKNIDNRKSSIKLRKIDRKELTYCEDVIVRKRGVTMAAIEQWHNWIHFLCGDVYGRWHLRHILKGGK